MLEISKVKQNADVTIEVSTLEQKSALVKAEMTVVFGKCTLREEMAVVFGKCVFRDNFKGGNTIFNATARVQLLEWTPPSTGDLDVDDLNDATAYDTLIMSDVAYRIEEFFGRNVDGFKVIGLAREDASDTYDVEISVPESRERQLKGFCQLYSLARSRGQKLGKTPVEIPEQMRFTDYQLDDLSSVTFFTELSVGYWGINK